MVGEDGFQFLDALEAPEAPQEARELPVIATLRRTWQRHYDRTVDERAGAAGGAAHRVRFKANRDLPPAAEGIESPYDAEARYRHKRDTSWTGSMVHVSETCEPTAPSSSRTSTRPRPASMRRSAPSPSSRRLSTRTCRRRITWSMRQIGRASCRERV